MNEDTADPADAPDTPDAPDTRVTRSDGAESGAARRRLWSPMAKPSPRQFVVAALLAALGFAAVVQVRATGEDSTYAGYREQDLIDVLNGLAAATQRTQVEIDRLTEARDELRSETTQRRAALDQAQKELDALNVLAGLVPVTGPGIRVTIVEKNGEVSVGSMLDTIEELRSVGAEAIQINGQVRLVAQSSIEDAPGGLLIDDTVVESPFVIDAIGVASTLAGAMNFALGPRNELENDGAEVEVTELGSMDIDTVAREFTLDSGEPG